MLASILPLFNGKRNLAQLAKIIQFAHDVESYDDARKMLIEVISGMNSDDDCIIELNDSVSKYVINYNAEDYILSPKGFNPKERLATPLSLGIMFSNDCQTKCLYCYAEKRIVPVKEHMPLERWKELFREAYDLGIEQVTISGGDPLYHKNSISLLEELIKLNMIFLVSTKCHITKEKAALLKKIGMAEPINHIVRELQFSIDGPNSFVADKMAGVPGFYERGIDSIKNLINENLSFRVKAVVTPFNAPFVEEWLHQMVDLGANKLACAAYGRSFYRHKDEYFLSPEDNVMLKNVFDKFEEEHPEVDLILTSFDAPEISTDPEQNTENKNSERNAVQEHFDKKKERWDERSHCSGGTSSMTITPGWKSDSLRPGSSKRRICSW